MGNEVFGKEFYDKMKKYIEQKGIKCESSSDFAEMKDEKCKKCYFYVNSA